jgi:pyruvate,water dikinase
VNRIVPLEEARDVALFGSKATGLGQAISDGLPVPPGFAVPGAIVEAVAAGDDDAIDELTRIARRSLEGPLAVRSSAVDEDGAQSSFAGQHLTLLNVATSDDLTSAVNEIWWSANSDSAISYRKRVGLFTRPIVGVVVQSLLDPVAAGVMFTRNPINGADERLIEASWGLGEAVVNGIVIPDNYRLDRAGRVLDKQAGLKRVAIRNNPAGGTFEEPVSPELVESFCLDDGHLKDLNDLASRCEHIYGEGRDIEWALVDGTIYLLQCRAITRGGL